MDTGLFAVADPRRVHGADDGVGRGRRARFLRTAGSGPGRAVAVALVGHVTGSVVVALGRRRPRPDWLAGGGAGGRQPRLRRLDGGGSGAGGDRLPQRRSPPAPPGHVRPAGRVVAAPPAGRLGPPGRLSRRLPGRRRPPSPPGGRGGDGHRRFHRLDGALRPPETVVTTTNEIRFAAPAWRPLAVAVADPASPSGERGHGRASGLHGTERWATGRRWRPCTCRRTSTGWSGPAGGCRWWCSSTAFRERRRTGWPAAGSPPSSTTTSPPGASRPRLAVLPDNAAEHDARAGWDGCSASTGPAQPPD